MKSHHWRQIFLHPAIPKPLTPQSPITQLSKTKTHHKIQMKSNSPKMVRQTHYWLLKTEPSEWSWEDQSSNNNLSKWDGVKNKQAQNNLKSMKIGDLCFFYHSGTRFRRIVGVVSVVREWYSDGEGSEGAVDVRAVGEMRRAVDLKEMKEEVGLKGFGLFRQPRLSVVPVPEEVWKRVCEMGGGMMVMVAVTVVMMIMSSSEFTNSIGRTHDVTQIMCISTNMTSSKSVF